MKIKIESRIEMHLAPEGCEEILYDVYFGFTGLPTTFPFYTKWKISRAGLTKGELIKWLNNYVLNYTNTNIMIKI